jgi:hypothetical protein
MQFIGELAALATSFFFARTALILTQTGRMVGSIELTARHILGCGKECH